MFKVKGVRQGKRFLRDWHGASTCGKLKVVIVIEDGSSEFMGHLKHRVSEVLDLFGDIFNWCQEAFIFFELHVAESVEVYCFIRNRDALIFFSCHHSVTYGHWVQILHSSSSGFIL